MGVVYMKATNIHPLVICARLPFTTTRYPTRHCSKISGAPAVSLPPYARFARNEVQLAKNYPCEEHFMSRTSPILKGPEHSHSYSPTQKGYLRLFSLTKSKPAVQFQPIIRINPLYLDFPIIFQESRYSNTTYNYNKQFPFRYLANVSG